MKSIHGRKISRNTIPKIDPQEEVVWREQEGEGVGVISSNHRREEDAEMIYSCLAR